MSLADLIRARWRCSYTADASDNNHRFFLEIHEQTWTYDLHVVFVIVDASVASWYMKPQGWRLRERQLHIVPEDYMIVIDKFRTQLKSNRRTQTQKPRTQVPNVLTSMWHCYQCFHRVLRVWGCGEGHVPLDPGSSCLCRHTTSLRRWGLRVRA